MKKIVVLIIMAVLISVFAFAEGPKADSGSTDKGNADSGAQDDTGNPDAGMPDDTPKPTLIAEGEQNKNMEQNQVQAQDVESVKNKIQSKQQEMNQEMEGMSEGKQKVYRNQNQVREAVHALKEMEGLVGGIGPQVSEIAKYFNNSVKNTLTQEEKIQTRSGFKRFFAGGDKNTAEELETEVGKNQEKLQELKQLKEQCDCGEEVKAMMQEQIQNMEQEQNRLTELAAKEKKSKGLFGWIWK